MSCFMQYHIFLMQNQLVCQGCQCVQAKICLCMAELKPFPLSRKCLDEDPQDKKIMLCHCTEITKLQLHPSAGRTKKDDADAF